MITDHYKIHNEKSAFNSVYVFTSLSEYKYASPLWNFDSLEEEIVFFYMSDKRGKTHMKKVTALYA